MVEIVGVGNMAMPNLSGVGTVIIWIFVFLIVAIVLGSLLVLFLISKNQRKVVELDISNRRMRIFNGRLKRNKKSGVSQFWAGKIKRFLPQMQNDSSFLKGKKDAYLLLKDRNGLYHTAKIPTYEDICKWYKVVNNLDLKNEKDKEKLQEKISSANSIYLMPNPHEDLDWLASQVVEADREFKSEHWWQSPTVAYIGVGFICFLMFVVTMIISKKM